MKSPSERPKLSSKSPQPEHYIIATVVVLTLIVAAVIAFVPSPSARLTNMLVKPPIATEQMFDDMPDSYLKSNALIILGAHLADEDEELNVILVEYAARKLKQLEQNR